MEDPTLFRNGNGSVRIARMVTIVGGGAAALIATLTIMWWVFSLVSGATSQPTFNAAVLTRLAAIEAAVQVMQVQNSGHELRIAAIRTDLENYRSSDTRFQDDIRASIGKVTDIVTDLRVTLAKSLAEPSRK